ncbi:hypothetical protein BJ878DRAFT_449513 [Calycina marina]|uniref:Transcriptional regulator n=1 Tax=Calycina marina TaxID=1763456 RepID=A0A9P7YVE6_9HELO|nr:hypothetical protein BJ878DRAFT_449513 [Calycina marina]
MAPNAEKLEAKLRRAVEAIYKEDSESLTVKKVRERVAKEQNLEDEFFTSREWKDKSKAMIKAWATKVVGDASEAEPSPVKAKQRARPKPVQKVASAEKKRARPEESPKPRKRQKKRATPSDVSEDEPKEVSSEDSAVSDFGDSESEGAPRSRRGNTKVKGKGTAKSESKRGSKKNKTGSSDDNGETDYNELSDAPSADDSEASAASTPPKKLKKAPESKKKVATARQKRKVVSDSDEDHSEDIKPPTKRKASAKKTDAKPSTKKQSKAIISEPDAEPSADEMPFSTKKANPKKSSPALKSSFTQPPEPEGSKIEAKANDSDSSEMSVVLDEPPKPKSQRKFKDATTSKATKGDKPKKEPKAAKDLSESEIKIKTLKSQLLKCGIRKIWQFELKNCEDDGEKTRHLQGMLRDAGMAGRFNDQRAKEIKEMRELQADLDAVKEGESQWGMGSGPRRGKTQRRSLNVRGSAESGDEEDNEDEMAEERAKRARADLAFLGSESESD